MNTEEDDKDRYLITGFSVGNKNESLDEMRFKCVVQGKEVKHGAGMTAGAHKRAGDDG